MYFKKIRFYQKGIITGQWNTLFFICKKVVYKKVVLFLAKTLKSFSTCSRKLRKFTKNFLRKLNFNNEQQRKIACDQNLDICQLTHLQYISHDI